MEKKKSFSWIGAVQKFERKYWVLNVATLCFQSPVADVKGRWVSILVSFKWWGNWVVKMFREVLMDIEWITKPGLSL